MAALTMYDPSTGLPVEVDSSQAGALFRAGKATFAADQDIPVTGSDGRVQIIKGAQAGDYFTSAAGLAGGASSGEALRQQQLQDKYGGAGGQLAAAGAGALRGASVGLSDAALTASGLVDPSTLRALEEVNPVASALGEVGGMVAPLVVSGGSAGAARAAGGGLLSRAALTAGEVATAPARAVMGVGRGVEGVAARVLGESTAARIASSTAAAAAEGALFGVGQEISRTSIQDVDLTAERLVGAVGHGALLGGALGAGTSVLGAVLRGGAAKLGEVGESLLARAETSEARLASELAATTPKSEATVAALASRAEREFALKSTGATPELVQQLRAAGGDLEQRAVRQVLDDLPRLAGREEGALLSPVEKAAAAAKLEAEASGKLASLGDELAAAGGKADLKRLAEEFRAQKGLVEAGGGRDPGGRYLPSSMGPDARKAMRETQEWLADLEKIGEGDLGKLTEASAKLRQGLDATAPVGQSLALDLRRDLAAAVDAEIALVRVEAEKALGPTFAARWTAAEGEQKAAAWLAEATAKGAKGAPEAFGLADAGKAALGALSNGNLLAVPLAVAGSYASRLVERHGADVAARLARAATRGEVIATIDRTMERLAGERVAGFVQGGRRALGELPQAAPGLGLAVEQAVRQEQPAAPARGSITQRFKAARDELLDAQPTRDARIAAATEGLDAQLGAAVRAKVLAASDFLASKLPRIEQRASLQPHLERERLPPFSEQEKYLRYERAVSDPLSVLDDARKGRLRRESVEALQAVYPTLYQGLRGEVAAAIADKSDRLTYQQRIQLSIMFPDMPADPSCEPKAIRAYQSVQFKAPSPFASTPAPSQPAAPAPTVRGDLRLPSLAPRSDSLTAA